MHYATVIVIQVFYRLSECNRPDQKSFGCDKNRVCVTIHGLLLNEAGFRLNI